MYMLYSEMIWYISGCEVYIVCKSTKSQNSAGQQNRLEGDDGSILKNRIAFQYK